MVTFADILNPSDEGSCGEETDTSGTNGPNSGGNAGGRAKDKRMKEKRESQWIPADHHWNRQRYK